MKNGSVKVKAKVMSVKVLPVKVMSLKVSESGVSDIYAKFEGSGNLKVISVKVKVNEMPVKVKVMKVKMVPLNASEGESEACDIHPKFGGSRNLLISLKHQNANDILQKEIFVNLQIHAFVNFYTCQL